MPELVDDDDDARDGRADVESDLAAFQDLLLPVRRTASRAKSSICSESPSHFGMR